MTILLDSGFIFALLAVKDKYHPQAAKIFNSEILEKYFPIYTSSLAVNETFTLSMKRTKRNLAFLKNLYSIFYGDKNFFEIIHIKPEDFEEVYRIFIKFSASDKLLSFVDASLIYLKNITNADLIVSFDSHFDGIIERIY